MVTVFSFEFVGHKVNVLLQIHNFELKVWSCAFYWGTSTDCH